MSNDHSLPLPLVVLIETKEGCANQQIKAFKELLDNWNLGKVCPIEVCFYQ